MRGIVRFMAPIALVAALAGADPSRAGDITITFVSDENWVAFAMLPDGSLGDSLGNTQCICLPPGGCPCCWTSNTSAIPGACWVWRPGTTPATTPVNLQGMYMRKTFDIPGLPDGGTLYIAADDYAEVRVNGALVGSIGSTNDYGRAAGAQASLTRFDLTPFLVSGPNEIVIRNLNGPGWFTGGPCEPCSFGQNPAGVLLGGSLSFDLATPAAGRSWGRLKVMYR